MSDPGVGAGTGAGGEARDAQGAEVKASAAKEPKMEGEER